jgi:AraC family transcriptional regulator of adaptative response / methylphosphotriester-DNA alkyltransferase methyltransferase
MIGGEIPDELWHAIVNNDRSYDDQFVYAIATTGIFCKPSCKSRLPKQNHVRIFHTASEALEAGFRPCKRCRPADARTPDQAWVEQIAEYLELHYTEPLTLQTIADMCHGSPHHLHRTFKRIKGITPADYIRQRRIHRSIEALLETDQPISEIAKLAGMPNTPYFTTLFKRVVGCTPGEYRAANQLARAEPARRQHRDGT